VFGVLQEYLLLVPVWLAAHAGGYFAVCRRRDGLLPLLQTRPNRSGGRWCKFKTNA